MSDQGIEIPYAELSAEALRGVLESVVLREGTDYGLHEFTFEQKVQQLHSQLQCGRARILFDPHTGTVTLLETGVARARGPAPGTPGPGR